MSEAAVGAILDGFVLGAISQAEVDAYVAAAGDDNPLHSDLDVARAAGLEGIPVPGMLIMAQLARCATQWPACAEVTSVSARFVGPVFVGQGIEIAGRVVALAGRQAVIRLTARRDGKIAVLGEARVTVRTA